MARDTPSIALAALIIACISCFGSLIADTILLAEYSNYLELRDAIKELLVAKVDISVVKRILQEVAARMQTLEAQQQQPAAPVKA